MLLQVTDLCVQLDSLGRRYSIVQGLNVNVLESECVGLVGESGSGKSVTAKVLLGLMKNRNTSISGSVLFQGTELLKLPHRAYSKLRGKELAIIFQEPMTALNPVVSVFEQVAEPLRVHCPEIGEREICSRVFKMFERVGLGFGDESRRLYPHELSGGMRQRVLIAMSVILKPKLLIADEPTTALDVTVQAQILSLLRELKREMGMSILLISHDLAVISEMTSRLYVMYAGKVVEEGETGTVLRNRMHPYTEGLFQSIPDLSENITRLKALPGTMPAPYELPVGCSFAERCAQRVARCDKERPELEIKKTGQRASCFEVH